jgi:hypothetical protein
MVNGNATRCQNDIMGKGISSRNCVNETGCQDTKNWSWTIILYTKNNPQ